MTEARYDGINWGSDQETTGLACLQNFDPHFYDNAPSKPKWVGDTNEVLLCGMVKALMDGHRMIWCAQMAYDLKHGTLTPEGAPTFAELITGTPNPLGSRETRDKARQFCAGTDWADVPALYDVLSFEVLQAVRSSRPIAEPKPLVGSSLSAVQAQLGALPVIAIVVLGVAAIAGATYLGSEASISFSKAWSAIEIEKAWAVNRAWAEVAIAQQAIAAGQKYTMSDWAKSRAPLASASQVSWAPLALGGALALAIGGAAYVFRQKAPTPVHANPAHFVPRRRRVRRKKNPANPTTPKRTRNPKRKPNPKPKRHAAPKRKRNPPLPRKRKSARKDARKRPARPSPKFLRSQHAKGRSDAQARAAWRLSHGKKHRKGHAGKR
jgi:hypothetical protein